MYSVVAEWDGCPDDKPLFRGNRELCIAWMRAMWSKYNRGKSTLSLVNPNGRCESFVL